MEETRPPLTPQKWCETLEQEYLSDYLRSGGSAVKFLTGSPEHIAEALSRLRATAPDYYHAHLDPAALDANGKRPDYHYINKLFFEVTRGVDWKANATIQAKQYLESAGIHLAEGRALNDLDGIAEDNGRDPQDLLNQYQREHATPQIRDTRLSLEFRIAITALGRSLLMPETYTPASQEVLLNWFAGRAVPGGAAVLKRIQIFEKIGLTTARPMLVSFCRWLPKTGKTGLILTLDFRPYEYKKVAKGRRQTELLERIQEAVEQGATSEAIAALTQAQTNAEPEVFYSDAAYMQMLTLLRRFIDEIDTFENFLLVVLTSPNFYKDKTLDPTIKRCFFDYDALQTRIGQEVHDAHHANPSAALVKLGGEQ